MIVYLRNGLLGAGDELQKLPFADLLHNISAESKPIVGVVATTLMIVAPLLGVAAQKDSCLLNRGRRIQPEPAHLDQNKRELSV